MSTKELKELLHHRIDEIEDESLLREISILLQPDEVELYDLLSEEEKHAIEEGLKDADEGRVYSSEETKERIKRWLAR